MIRSSRWSLAMHEFETSLDILGHLKKTEQQNPEPQTCSLEIEKLVLHISLERQAQKQSQPCSGDAI